MSPPEPPARNAHALRWATAAALAAAAGLVLLAMQPRAAADTAPPQATPTPSRPAAAPAMAATEAPAAPTAAAVHTPWPSTGWLAPPGAGTVATPAMTLSELREVKATLASTPRAGADQGASADAMFFADVAQRFHQVLSTGQEAEPGELPALAQMLDAMLDTRLQRGDISWPDARLVKAAVLGTLHPLHAARQEQVEDWEIRLRQGLLRASPDRHHPPR